MYSLLVVGPGPDLEGLAGAHPSVEVLRASDPEEAVEKLGRNRRIDGVLILGGMRFAAEAIAAIRDDNPAPPPLFVVAGDEDPPAGAQSIAGATPADLLARIVREIGPP